MDLGPLMSAPALDTPGKTFGADSFPDHKLPVFFDGVQRYNIVFTSLCAA